MTPCNANTEEDFWQRVHIGSRDECWLWLGSFFKNGYGQFSWKCKNVRAHRLAYEFVYGPIPKGLLVLHSCDNPPCCNVKNHLFLGTHKDNAVDREQKSRCPKLIGTERLTAKLTEEKVLKILGLLSQGKSQYEVAGMYGVSRAAIQNIVRGRNWQHVVRTATKRT